MFNVAPKLPKGNFVFFLPSGGIFFFPPLKINSTHFQKKGKSGFLFFFNRFEFFLSFFSRIFLTGTFGGKRIKKTCGPFLFFLDFYFFVTKKTTGVFTFPPPKFNFFKKNKRPPAPCFFFPVGFFFKN